MQNFETAFCETCRKKWNQALAASCPHCLAPATECRCMPGELSALGVLFLGKLFFYSSDRQNAPENRLLYTLKHKPNKRLERFVAGELWRVLQTELKILDIESVSDEVILCPVPRGKRAKTEYGFDQSERILTALSECSGIPLVCLIRRNRQSAEQKKLTRRQRFRNAEKAFSLALPDEAKGKCVVLFDDIVTSGASMAACAALVKKAGAGTVISLCVAQNPE